MTGVPVEQMLGLWCVELRQVKAPLQSLFADPSVAASTAAFLDGLLGPEQRKTDWIRAETAGDPGPWRHIRRCSAAATRRPMPCGTWCATMRLRRSPCPEPCW